MTMGTSPAEQELAEQERAEQERAEQERAEKQLYGEFAAAHMVPLWTEIGNLMPAVPTPTAVPHVWRWSVLYPLAERAGELIPVGRGGERRAISLANPGFKGLPYATPTLWAAIQYLGPHEEAPEHRHSQNAFRFVIEGAGVWTVVDGDPVAMRRGDFLLTPGWAFHGHQNVTGHPMAWIDGLDIPFVHLTDSAFFEPGPDSLSVRQTPERSRGERLWAHPGLRPLSSVDVQYPKSPLAAYRWEHTDAALRAQLELEDEGYPGVVEPGHAAIRFTNPATGGDVLPTIRAEFHRLRPGAASQTRREVGSSVFQVFQGSGVAVVDGIEHELGHGDLVVVPSWSTFQFAAAGSGADLFRFSDTPIFERLHQDRVQIGA